MPVTWEKVLEYRRSGHASDTARQAEAAGERGRPGPGRGDASERRGECSRQFVRAATRICPLTLTKEALRPSQRVADFQVIALLVPRRTATLTA
jgi:hypothetical protein